MEIAELEERLKRFCRAKSGRGARLFDVHAFQTSNLFFEMSRASVRLNCSR